MRALIGVLVVVGCFVGCGGDGPAGSCQIPATGGGGEKCIDFTRGYSSGSAKDTCSMASNATYSDAACSATNRIGHCTQSSPDGAFTQVLNFYGPTTADAAMMTCASAGGTFAAN